MNGDCVRDEGEQVRYSTELLVVFSGAGVDTAFWFTFAGYQAPRRDDPRRDLDLASYGLAAILDDNGKNWRPKEAFRALAAACGVVVPRVMPFRGRHGPPLTLLVVFVVVAVRPSGCASPGTCITCSATRCR